MITLNKNPIIEVYKRIIVRLEISDFWSKVFQVLIFYVCSIILFQVLSYLIIELNFFTFKIPIVHERAISLSSIEFYALIASIFVTYFVFSLETFKDPDRSFQFVLRTKLLRPLVFFTLTLLIFVSKQFIQIDDEILSKFIFRTIVFGNLLTVMSQLDSLFLSLEYRVDKDKYKNLLRDSAKNLLSKLESIFEYSKELWEKEGERVERANEISSKIKLLAEDKSLLLEFNRYRLSDKPILELKLPLENEEIRHLDYSYLVKFIESVENVLKKVSMTLFNISPLTKKENEVELLKAKISITFTPLNNYSDEIAIITISLLDKPSDTSREEILRNFQQNESEILKTWRNLNRKIFIVSPYDGLEDYFETEFTKFAHRYHAAISSGSISQLKSINKYYLEILQSFNRYLHDKGINIDFTIANNQFNAFPSDTVWGSLSEIMDSIRDGVDLAFSQSIPTIKDEVMHLIIAILYKFSREYNPLLILYSLNLMKYSFSLTIQNQLKHSKSHFLERNFYAPIKEVSNYIIKGKYEDKEISEDEFKFYIVQMLYLYQFYLKTCHSNDDIESFKYFANKLSKFYELFIDELEQTYNTDTDEDKIGDYIQKSKQEMVFGFLAWLAKDIHYNKEYIEILAILLPDNIPKLYDLYVSVLDDRGSRKWGWEFWHDDDEDLYDMRFRSIDFSNEMAYIFLKRASMVNISGELKPSRTIIYNYQNTLKQRIEEISKNESSEFNKERLAQLGELIEKAISNQENIEVNKVEEYEVDSATKNEFIKKIISLIDTKNKSFRELFKRFNSYIDETSKNETYKKLFGINQIIEKEAFIKNWHVSYSNLEESFANGIHSFENDYVWEKLDKKLKEETDYNKFLKILKKGDYLLITNKYDFWRIGEKYNIKRGNQTNSDPLTSFFTLDGQEIYQIWTNKIDKQVLIAIPKECLPEFVQLPPKFKSTKDQDVYDKLQIQLEFLSHNEEEMKGFIDKPPKWLKDIGDVKAQKNYLKDKGVLRIYENIELRFKKGCHTGFKFYFDDQVVE